MKIILVLVILPTYNAMLTSVIPFTVRTWPKPRLAMQQLKVYQPEQAEMATAYCQKYTDGVTESMSEVWDWTKSQFEDADKMSSLLQGATNKFLAEILKPKRSTRSS